MEANSPVDVVYLDYIYIIFFGMSLMFSLHHFPALSGASIDSGAGTRGQMGTETLKLFDRRACNVFEPPQLEELWFAKK